MTPRCVNDRPAISANLLLYTWFSYAGGRQLGPMRREGLRAIAILTRAIWQNSCGKGAHQPSRTEIENGSNASFYTGTSLRVESTVNAVVSKRFVKKQQMQWTLRGAQLLMQTRTKTFNGELEKTFREWYSGFRVTDVEAAEKAA